MKDQQQQEWTVAQVAQSLKVCRATVWRALWREDGHPGKLHGVQRAPGQPWYISEKEVERWQATWVTRA